MPVTCANEDNPPSEMKVSHVMARIMASGLSESRPTIFPKAILSSRTSNSPYEEHSINAAPGAIQVTSTVAPPSTYGPIQKGGFAAPDPTAISGLRTLNLEMYSVRLAKVLPYERASSSCGTRFYSNRADVLRGWQVGSGHSQATSLSAQKQISDETSPRFAASESGLLHNDTH